MYHEVYCILELFEKKLLFEGKKVSLVKYHNNIKLVLFQNHSTDLALFLLRVLA